MEQVNNIDSSNDKATVLIDGNSVIYRAFYNVPPLSANGIPTGVIHVFLSVLDKLKNNKSIKNIVLVFDAKGKNYRHDMYPAYKETRDKMPEDLIVQLNLLREILPYTGYKIYVVEGYEADDVINTLSKDIEGPVWIITKDKDLHQLVNDKVKIYDYQKDILIDREKVFEKFELYPEKIADMLAIAGDTSDNIPGVAGIGPKGAKKLLDEYGDIDGIYANIDKLKGKQKENLINNKENAYLSRKLVALTYIEDIQGQQIPKDENKLREYFEKYNLKQHLNALNNSANLNSDTNNLENNSNNAQYALKNGKVENPEIIACINDEYYGCDEKNYECYTKEKVENLTPKYYYNIKAMLKNNIKIKDNPIDLMVTSWLQDPDSGGLKPLKNENVEEFLGKLILEDDNVINSLKENDLMKIYEDIELPVTRILAEMENVGIILDVDKLKGVAEFVQNQLNIALLNIKENLGVGDDFNPNSPKQIAAYLYDKLQLTGTKKTKSGFSTDEDALKDLLVNYPEHFDKINSILKYREISKLNSTYTINLLEYLEEDGRIHTEYKQTGTATGRLSSSNPNLQNIPQRGEWAKILRKSFVSKEGYSFLSLDYSQIELRVLAHLSQDKNLVRAFNENVDVHDMTARNIFHIDNNAEVDSDMRRMAKAVNFGIVYGLSAFGLARDIKVTQKEAKQFIEGYNELYVGVFHYMNNIKADAHLNGYSQTIHGRKRYIRDINSRNANLKNRAERMAINAPIQGSAADIIKLAMIKCNDYIKKENVDAKMVLQIHDELIFEVNDNIIDEFREKITNLMENADQLSVPLIVNSEVGKNWSEL